MCLHSHRYSIGNTPSFHVLSIGRIVKQDTVPGQPEENLAFEASPPFWAENPSTVRPTLTNKT